MPRRALHIKDAGFLRVLEGALGQGALSFSDACRAIRGRDGLTQAEFARRARVALKVVKEIEAGTGNPTLQSLSRIAKLAGLRVGLLRPMAMVQFDAAGRLLEGRARDRQTHLRKIKRGRASARKEHRRNALRGTDFTIRLAKID